MCGPMLATDARAKGAVITYVIPYVSPSAKGGRLMNRVWAEQFGKMVAAAKNRRGLS
jgi:hypothetical protein